jgi:hypothetical protein
MNEICVYLAHYGTTRLFEPQVKLIRHFFQYDQSKTKLVLFGFVDAADDATASEMRKAWEALDVRPIDLPRNRASYFAVSYGLAFQFIYDNYIKHDKYISVFLENDMFPIDFIDIEKYCEPYKVCGDIRYNTAHLPDRMIMFYLGLQIFNHRKMTDKEQFSGLLGHVTSIESGRVHPIDCGGLSYNWLRLNDNYKDCKHILTIGNEDPNYTPYTSAKCEVHNVTTDLENLPPLLHEGYHPSFRSINYENLFLHLERMGGGYMSQEEIQMKTKWIGDITERLLKVKEPLSLAIPTKDRWAFLSVNLPKYLENPYITEIIICDENGNDAVQIMSAPFYCDKIKVHVNEHCLGAFENKQRAVSLASNKYVCLMDSDNYAPKEYFDAWYAYVGLHGYDSRGIYSPSRTLPQPNHPGHNFTALANARITKDNMKHMYQSHGFCAGLFNIGNYIVKKDVFMKSQPNTDHLKQLASQCLALDVIYRNYLLMTLGNGTIHIVPNMAYDHVTHSGSYYMETCNQVKSDLFSGLIIA